MKEALYRIEIFYTVPDFRGLEAKKHLRGLGYDVTGLVTTDNYLINTPLSDDEADAVAKLLTQSVTQQYCINKPYVPENFNHAVQIGFLPGVTDNIAHTVKESIEDLLKNKLKDSSVFSSTTYFFSGAPSADINAMALELYNPLIQTAQIKTRDEYTMSGGMGKAMPLVSISEHLEADIVSLSVSDEELLKIGKYGIAEASGQRRGPLALDMPYLKAIQEYFHKTEKREPTDIELESIAQTWSEHCKHTIFAASIDEIKDGLYKHYIKGATNRIRKEKGDADFCLSVFTDNAGGIAFDDNYIISDKVETHNSPSALDPFGGAITGIVGVNRDAIGFGMAAKPIANRYGFCFADPADERPLYRDKTNAMLSPRRIMEGVIRGVNVGGNTSGIPTPQGFVYFDERYKGKPLVFVGTVGLSPRQVNGAPFVEKSAKPGDNIVVVGGRVGADGIHGATFSSEVLSTSSPATAVQIGDPITQKKLSDAIVKEARDMGLYNSITDNGAGGLSCSVAEMARESGGFEVHLDSVPLKYPGLAPWQIWISESQERMTLSVPDDKLDTFLELMTRRGVEASVIGRFTASGRGIVIYNKKKIFDLDLNFLHDGLPPKFLKTTYKRGTGKVPYFDCPADMNNVFIVMASRLNTAGFGFISNQYDHEVQGNSLIKPLQGKGMVNGNASVIKPVFDSPRAVVLSQALYPSYSEIDTYGMAACSIDTAIRNVIASGGSLDHIALLDNFCWCDSNNPERLGQLKEAARACYDFAVAYGTPFISGKDSMFNDFSGYDEFGNQVNISIPPTLLISSIGIVSDWQSCQTIDFKRVGDVIYLAGETDGILGGSEYFSFMGSKISGKPYSGTDVPRVDAAAFSKLYRAVEKALKQGLVVSSISIERGGLGLALAKSSIAGRLGCAVDLARMNADSKRDDILLFSESQGRLLLSVAPENTAAFESCFDGLPLARIGDINGDGRVKITGVREKTIIDVAVEELEAAYHGLFGGF